MFDYMTVQEAATKWGISERRIQNISLYIIYGQTNKVNVFSVNNMLYFG